MTYMYACIAAAIHLDTHLSHPHKCYYCGSDIDTTALHKLSYRKGVGRSFRHGAINNIIPRALSVGNTPSQLEPSGFYRSDGKRPDGITIVLWERGCTFLWDATCIDTFASLYINVATKDAGLVVKIAETRKRKNYEVLSAVHMLTPIAVETSGILGSETRAFLHKLLFKVKSVTLKEKFPFYLTQQSNGNALSIQWGMLCPYSVLMCQVVQQQNNYSSD